MRQKNTSQPVVNNTLIENNVTVSAPVVAPPPVVPSAFACVRTDDIGLDKLKIQFASDVAGIKNIIFSDYEDYSFLVDGFYFQGLPAKFVKQALGKESRFSYQDSEKRITQVYDFSNTNDTFELTLLIKNLKNDSLSFNLPFILSGIKRLDGQDARFQNYEVVLAEQDKEVRVSPWKDFISGTGIKFLALRERYFCLVMQPKNVQCSAFVKKINGKESIIGINIGANVPAEQEVAIKFLVYAGPENAKSLFAINPAWRNIVYYGWADPLAKFLLAGLKAVHSVVRNWGVAVIVFSILIYIVLFPLSIKQMRSMKEMQLLQPKIEELRKLYKDNPQRLNKETMELYKLHKINPLGGCLPLLLQIPIFFSLYQVLSRSLALRGADFLWIKDLSAPDKLFTLPWSLPVIGNEVNILPILMSAGMFFQMKSTPTSSASSDQQKMMLVMMPVLFGFFFYHMPSGLVLYWFTNSLLMLFFQLKMR